MFQSDVVVSPKRHGDNPLLQTVRGRLQLQRSNINDKLNREILLRNGAEKLLRVVENKKIKGQVSLELSFFNSNIQVYREELIDVNSSLDVYQFDSEAKTIPMLPVGLKETKEVDFQVALSDFILEHYSENNEKYLAHIQRLNDLRQAVRLPSRDDSGIEMLVEYFGVCFFLEKRFFAPHKKLPVFFHWYDSLSGIPHIQRSIAFERSSILFNIAAIYSQIACKQDRSVYAGLEAAIRYFQLSAGTFEYIHRRFHQAPSVDMQPSVLATLKLIMLAQAQECVLERCLLGGVDSHLSGHVRIAQETSSVATEYHEALECITTHSLAETIPASWVSIIKVKWLYYLGLSHYYLSNGLLTYPDTEPIDFDAVLGETTPDHSSKPEPLSHHTYGKVHAHQALVLHDQALRDHDTCRHLRKIDAFKDILQISYNRSLERYEDLEIEDDFTEIVRPRTIRPLTSHPVSIDTPKLSALPSTDWFYTLGPLKAFNACTLLTSPRLVTMVAHTPQRFGFSVHGDSPVTIAHVEHGSVAHMSGVKVSDIIIAVGDVPTKHSTHPEVADMIKQCGPQLNLKVVSPTPQVASFSFSDQVSVLSSEPYSNNTSHSDYTGRGGTSHSDYTGRGGTSHSDYRNTRDRGKHRVKSTKLFNISRLFSRRSSTKSHNSSHTIACEELFP